jgi:septum formation protein
MLLNELMREYRLILASKSPRRKQLLEGLDLTFEVIVREDIPEDPPPHLGMIGIPVWLAENKSRYYTDLLDRKTLLITADTIVWHKNSLIGKPTNLDEARNILARLSESMHEVVTGVCLSTSTKSHTFYSHSKVIFRKLTSEEIDYYVDTYKPLDKAGAYGIQEWIGYAGIEKIEGSFYNVMGLPVQKLHQELISFLQTI